MILLDDVVEVFCTDEPQEAPKFARRAGGNKVVSVIPPGSASERPNPPNNPPGLRFGSSALLLCPAMHTRRHFRTSGFLRSGIRASSASLVGGESRILSMHGFDRIAVWSRRVSRPCRLPSGHQSCPSLGRPPKPDYVTMPVIAVCRLAEILVVVFRISPPNLPQRTVRSA
jgi:hypothetical protein